MEAAAAAWERGTDPRALEGLAAALLAGGQAEAALDLLAAHRDQVAGDPGLMRPWAVALRRAGRWAEAADVFEALAAALEAGREAGREAGLEAALEAGREVGQAAGREAGLDAGQGRAPEVALDAGRERVPEVAGEAARARAGGARAAARAADARDGWSRSADAAGDARAVARARWARAEALDCRLRDRDPAEAAEAVRRMLLLPSAAANPYVLALRGRLLMRSGDAASAVEPLMAATAALPDDATVAAAAAFAVRRSQGPGAALPLLERALRLRADQPQVLAALVADARRLRRVAATRRTLIELARSAENPGPVWNAVRRLREARPQGPSGGAPTVRRGG